MVIRIEPPKIAYMAVPKAACSSVKAILAAIDPAVEITDPTAIDLVQVHRIYPTQRFRPRIWNQLDDHFRFSVVRDPLKRLFSVYTNRVVALGELRNCASILRGRVNLPTDPDPDFFFQNIARYIAAASVIKHHALPAHLFTGTDFGQFSKVYRTSEINQLSEDLSGLAGREVAVPHFNSSEKPLTLESLKPETHRVLAERLEPQYEHLSSFFDNPFTKHVHAAAK